MRTHSHDVGIRGKRVLKTEAVQCTASQTKKQNGSEQKSAKMKIQDERKASTNPLALQEQIPTMWEHGPENESENPSSAVQSKPDQKSGC